MYRYRLCVKSDFRYLAEFLKQYGDFNCSESMWPLLPDIWAQWAEQGTLGAAVYWEAIGNAVPSDRLGYGLSAFLTEPFASELESKPRPYVANALYEAVLSGSPALVASRRDVAAANASEGVNLIMLHNPLRYGDLANPIAQKLLPLGMSAWYATHAGHYCKRIFWEANGSQFAQMSVKGGFEVLSDFSDHPLVSHLSDERRPFLHIKRRPEESDPDFSADALWLFRQHKPLLGLTTKQQLLLMHALEGETDRTLVKLLGIADATIKKQWRAIFDRFGTRLPGLFDGPGSDHPETRGPSKRQVVLDYLRQNRHELRPYVSSD